MKFSFLSVCIFLSSLIFAQSSVAVIIGDRDWRQITDTVNISPAAILVACPPANNFECSGSINGVNLDGWTLASEEDVFDMLETISSYDVSTDEDMQWAADVLEYFSPTTEEGAFLHGVVRDQAFSMTTSYALKTIALINFFNAIAVFDGIEDQLVFETLPEPTRARTSLGAFLYTSKTVNMPLSDENLAAANEFFDFAEEEYPEFFASDDSTTYEYEGFLLRGYKYAGDDVYLATQGNEVFVYGNIVGGLKSLGLISDYMPAE